MTIPVRRYALPEGVWPAAAVLAGLAMVASSPLFAAGWYLSHEDLTPLERLIALSAEIRHGDLYPRWLFDSYGGNGSPYFNFYSPAFYFAAAYLHVVGVPLTISLKIPAFLLFFAGAWGMYLWVRGQGGHLGGMIAAILYLFAPYHFVDIYVRGALAEFSALAVLPYLFLGIDLALDPARQRTGVLAVAAGAALMPLTHHLSTLMIIPFALFYTLWRWRQTGRSRKRILAPLGGALAGAGLSAFYWLPMLLERRYLLDFAGALTSGYYAYTRNFVSPGQWFSPTWGFGSPFNGTEEELSRQVGIVLLGAVALVVLTLSRVDLSSRHRALTLLALGGLALFMTTAASAFVYRAVPPLAYVQFPWRFLGPAVFFLAAAGAGLGTLPLARRFGLPLLILLAALSIVVSSAQRSVSKAIQQDFVQAEADMISGRGLGGFSNWDEYLPRWASRELLKARPELKPYAPTAEITRVQVVGRELRFTVTARAAPAMLVVPWHYFPGWRASASGQDVPVRPSQDGFLQLAVPPGTFEVRVWFGTTWPRVAGWLLAAATLAGLLGTFAWPPRGGTTAGT